VRHISPGGIPFIDWGGEGPPLHFAHANGFPPQTYSAFVQRLTPYYHVLGMECRALWGTQNPAQFRHWRELADDLARFAEEMQLEGAVLMGHSLGAVPSLFCAAVHPDFFRALVLIDPVIPPVHMTPAWALAGWLGFSRHTALTTGARKRRMDWPSRQMLYRAYRAARVFERWQDQFLEDYVVSGSEELPGGGVHLRYPREWEARIFETAPPDSWLAMPRLRNLPLLVLRGQLSTTCTRSALHGMRWLLPHGVFVEIESADHFVPMCQPAQAIAAIETFLGSSAEVTE